MKLIKLIFSVIIVFLLFIVIIGFVPLKIPKMEVIANKIASKTNTKLLNVDDVTVTLWRGVKLNSILIKKQFINGTVITINVKDVHLTYKPLVLIQQRKTITDFVKKFVSNNTKFLNEFIQDGNFLLKENNILIYTVLNKLYVNSLNVNVTKKGDSIISVKDVFCNIKFKKSNKIVGKIYGEKLYFNDINIEKPNVKIKIQKDILELNDLNAKLYDGNIKGQFVILPYSQKIKSGSIKIRNININKMYKNCSNAVGFLDGIADVNFELESSSWEPEEIIGTGDFQLKNLKANKIPLLRTMVVSVAVPELSKINMSSVKGNLSLKNNVLFFNDVVGIGYPVDLQCSGRLFSNGKMKFSSECSFKSSYKNKMSPFIWNTMIPKDNGGRSFIFTVTGTFFKPHIRISKKITKRAIKNIFNAIGLDF